MQIKVKIKEGGKWRGPTSDEFTGTLDYRLALLAKKETVIQFEDESGELILATGEWKEFYKSKGKRVVCLQELSELLNVHPTIDAALKTFTGAQIEIQESLL